MHPKTCVHIYYFFLYLPDVNKMQIEIHTSKTNKNFINSNDNTIYFNLLL